MVAALVGGLALLSPGSALSAPVKQRATRKSEKNATKQELLLIAGLQSTLDIPFEPCPMTEECIKVANGSAVKVQYSKEKKQLIFTPQKKGETTITVRNEQGDIALILKTMITDNNLERKAGELRTLLRDIEGIEIKIMGDRIVIDGEVVVISDLNRLYTVVSDDSYRGVVLLLVGVSPVGMQIMAERIQAEINKPNVKVRVFNGLFLVEGQVDSANEAQSVKDIATSMVSGFAIPKLQPQNLDLRGPIDIAQNKVKDPIVMRLTIAASKPKPPEKMLRITVDFVELSKDYLRNFGFQWIPSLDAGGQISFGESTTGGVTSSGTGSLAGTIGNLFPKLNSAQNAGYARILEESIMIVKNNGQADFKRVLQIPVQTVNAQGQPNFVTQPIGPQILIKPRVVGQTEDIEMDIDFGYKGLAGKTQTAIISLDHSYKSTVVVKNGESAAIVNALSNAISTAFNKDPVGQVPANPLFTLLRSKAFQKNKTQFVVFVTPQIIESSATGTEDIKSKYGLKRKQ